ncbi:MAG: hypothetical protein WAV48_06495 [Candidatus Magasanikiibacteriota bacterium]
MKGVLSIVLFTIIFHSHLFPTQLTNSPQKFATCPDKVHKMEHSHYESVLLFSADIRAKISFPIPSGLGGFWLRAVGVRTLVKILTCVFLSKWDGKTKASTC